MSVDEERIAQSVEIPNIEQARTILSGQPTRKPTAWCCCMVLLHGFVKKTQKTPKADLELAIKRKKEIAS